MISRRYPLDKCSSLWYKLKQCLILSLMQDAIPTPDNVDETAVHSLRQSFIIMIVLRQTVNEGQTPRKKVQNL